MKKLVLMAVITVTIMSSCSSYMASGAAFGGMLGSAIGGIAGGPRGHDVGTLIGVTAGAVAGAAAEAHEQEMIEQRARARAYNDDVYTNTGSARDVEKAKRIQSYHDKVANRGRGYSSRAYNYNDNSTYGNANNEYNGYSNNSGNGFRLERANGSEPQVINQAVAPRDTVNASGFVKEGKYDDRIEMK